ncbi:MAG: TfoX/Sxy family protein [Ignavibacteria bacterium]|nr:TfoX/Sxy family protein [Ignavibacteria bacterium]
MKGIKNYVEGLANRVRMNLAVLPCITEKEMFGGLVFMYNEKMCVGIVKDDLMCRVDPESHTALVEKNGCRTMDFTKKPMKGYIYVEQSVLKTKEDLNYWIGLALDYNKFAKSSKKR